jgi:hypothetical protein
MNKDTRLYNTINQGVNKPNRVVLKSCIPIVKTFSNVAFPLSVLGCEERCKDWFYSNFINIYSCYNDQILSTNYDVQFFEDEVYYLNRDHIMISNLDMMRAQIIETLISSINKKQYICVFLDEYYIPYSPDYDINHKSHETFIIGYDKNEEVFICLSYGYDGKYKYRILKFENFINAYESKNFNRNLPFLFFSAQASDYRPTYKMDIDLVYDQIEGYINGKDFLYKNKNINNINWNSNNKYGIDVLKDYNLYLSDMLKMKCKNDKLVLTVFYILFEHKRCMQRRLYYLYEKKIIDIKWGDEYGEIVKLSHDILDSAVKYNSSEKKEQKIRNNILNDIIYGIKEIEKLETIILSRLIEAKNKCLFDAGETSYVIKSQLTE